MDRARRAEPYSNATIWTREIARNLAGHLDRLSRVHSCVDSTSPKWAVQAANSKHNGLPLKRAGQVSPLKHGHSLGSIQSASIDVRDEQPSEDKPEGEDGTAQDREEGDPGSPACSSPVRRRRTKAPKKIKTVSRRTQLEAYRHETLSLEPQRAGQDTSIEIEGVASGSYYEHLESPEVSTHSKKNATLDYHRRQELQRIYQENQALAKRLRNTKPTLSSKDWEKDDKWNQSFLKTQERRRQALHNEMTRTLTSPHSALIRVKPVDHPGGQGFRRPYTDHGLSDDGTLPVIAIEVTTPDTKLTGNGRDCRRRRSANEEKIMENRHHSTASNHRRILELRKQKERGNRRQHSQVCGESESGSGATIDAGPPDELVNVRFTFSREGNRAPCTPYGITGQFSPALELEAALEASYLDDDGPLLLPVPMLEPPHSSRLDGSEDTNASDAVLSALQACIDRVVSQAEQAVVVEDTRPAPPSPIRTEEVEEVVAATVDEESLLELKSTEEGGQDRAVDHSNKGSPELSIFQEEVDARQYPEAADSMIDQEPDDLADAPHPDFEAESHVAFDQQPARTLEMETSAYGSEFDGEDSMTAAVNYSDEQTPETRPLAVQVEEPEENEYEDDHGADENEYEDDHVEEDDEHNAQDEHEADEPQYDDDLEPETDHGAKDGEQSYGDDGFADDEE